MQLLKKLGFKIQRRKAKRMLSRKKRLEEKRSGAKLRLKGSSVLPLCPNFRMKKAPTVQSGRLLFPIFL